MVTEKVARKVSRDSSLVPGPSPPNLDQSFQTLPKQPVGTGLWKAEGGGKGPVLQRKGAEWGQQTTGRPLCIHSPETSITFTNTYINTLHTRASLGGRSPQRLS